MTDGSLHPLSISSLNLIAYSCLYSYLLKIPGGYDRELLGLRSQHGHTAEAGYIYSTTFSLGPDVSKLYT
jgi:hypothetical protein